LFLTC